MSTLIKHFVFLLLVSFSYDAFAQVAKNIIVEHFTNTWCSVCKSRNPGFYENLNKQNNVLHISYHPSSPYPNCDLHQHNPAENDGRTNYYKIYGGTPRLIIQGVVLSVFSNYSDSSIFEPYLAKTTPLSIAMEQIILEDSLLEVKILITNEAEHDMVSLKLFAGVAEQLVPFDARNGEKEHFDVFRKAYTDIKGDLVRIGKAQGDTYEFRYQIPMNDTWDLEELFSFVILQEDNNAVIQAETTKAGLFSEPVNINEIQGNSILVFPNPVNDLLHLTLPDQETNYLKIYDCNGKLWINTTFKNHTEVAVHSLNKGLYFVEINQNGKRFQHKIVKE